MTTFARVMHVVIPALWVAWALYWLFAARDTKPTSWREAKASRALYVVPLLLGFALLGAPRLVPAMLKTRFVAPGPFLPSLGGVLALAGLGLAVWARVHLGREWSGLVTLKKGHVLIRTGPYRAIRHPIYTGLLLAVIGTTLAIGEWRGLLAIFCIFVGFIRNVRAEEMLMGCAFPQYAEYRKTTAALVPKLY